MYKIKRSLTLLISIFLLNPAFSNTPKTVEHDDGNKTKPGNNHQVWQIDTTKGHFLIELLPEEAPETVKNFIQYAKSGFYDGTIFHRVIPGFVLQAGGFTKDMAKKTTQASIRNEAHTEVKNLRGTLSMARLSDPDSATSQFFINLKDNRNLDKRASNLGYAVFAKVIDGMTVIDQIAYVRTGTIGIYRDVPLEPIEIKHVKKVATKITAKPEFNDPLPDSDPST